MPPKAVVKILKKKPAMTWWVKDKDGLNLRAATEAILNYGDWQDAQVLFKTAGMKRIKDIFECEIKGRNNYDDQVKQFFKLYFKKHAS